jgi:hypothetical protein
LEYFEWQWVSEIIKPSYTSLYDEIYSYFISNPKKMYHLSPRKFEILISEIFRNQGYRTELGKGQNDKGVDIKLYQNDAIDQITTLVQVKRYNDNLPIKLESVAYLKQMVEDEGANRGLFVTTSRYLPQSKKFAQRHQNRLILADTNNVTKWCENVRTIIKRDKSLILEDNYIIGLLKINNSPSLIGKIVYARKGYNMIYHEFCMIILDSPHVSLLIKLESKSIDNSNNGQFGYEIPILNESILRNKNKENVFRAQKKINENGKIGFWGKKNYYVLWDSKPLYFNLMD